MSETKTAKTPRAPHVLEAYGAIAFMLLAIGVGNGVLGFDLKIMLVVSAAFNLIMAFRCHHSWPAIEKAICDKIASMGGCFLVLMAIGFLIATLMLAGTVPVMVSWLARLIAPKFVLVLSFVLVAILAEMIGSSFASMGTLGIVMFSVAVVQGLPPGIAAAAVICGANFGQYMSPIADITNCAASVNKIDIYDYMKTMALPIGITTVITAAFFFVMGLRYSTVSAEALVNVEQFIASVNDNFNTNPIVVLPLVLAVVLSVMKVPALLVMFSSGFVAIVVAVVFQGFGIGACINVAYSGFSVEALMGGATMSDTLTSLLNRGGIFSMADSVVFVLLAVTCTALLGIVGVFKVVQETAFRKVTHIGNLTLVSTLFILFFTLVTADPYPAIIIGAEVIREPFIQAGYHPKKAAVISLANAQLFTCILPWSFVAVYSANVYGVTIGQFVPYAIFFPLLPIVIVVLSYLGIGNDKLPDDYLEKSREKQAA